MRRPLRTPVVGIAIASIIIAAALLALYLFTPPSRKPGYVEGRPLLDQTGLLFTDTQVDLQFTPPPNWAMQERTTQSPHSRKPERTIVKYKQLIPGSPVAWLKVSVAEVPIGQPLPQYLRSRKPPDPNWKITKEIEDGLTINGRPAARVTYGGPFDPSGRGSKDFVCEVVAVRRGEQVFCFAGTFAVADQQEQKLIRNAINGAVFGRKQFAQDR